MKVIKDNTKRHYTCYECGSILRVSKKDWKLIWYPPHMRLFANQDKIKVGFFCPICDKFNTRSYPFNRDSFYNLCSENSFAAVRYMDIIDMAIFYNRYTKDNLEVKNKLLNIIEMLKNNKR